jgi:tripartite-type tricarboxylate transporter receptor subunit TctC
VNAVLTGEVQMTLIDTGPIAPMLQAGKVRALAVTSDQRLANYPNVPTLKEQGVDLAVNLWSGLLAPAGTPVPIIARVQAEVARIMAMPDVVDRMNKLDIRPVGGTPAEMAKTIASEIELWSGVARANQITAQ